MLSSLCSFSFPSIMPIILMFSLFMVSSSSCISLLLFFILSSNLFLEFCVDISDFPLHLGYSFSQACYFIFQLLQSVFYYFIFIFFYLQKFYSVLLTVSILLCSSHCFFQFLKLLPRLVLELTEFFSEGPS
uniref:Uncharacterized protein n=1 Tax=Rousettus aegyptiacus TaxID=9407 RepID=A0A7J8DII9_ROUAE|nr:hypothetical protein HJG63_008610 [Rousettus aegyptiacus]